MTLPSPTFVAILLMLFALAWLTNLELRKPNARAVRNATHAATLMPSAVVVVPASGRGFFAASRRHV